MSKFRKGDVVWLPSIAAKPVLCRCCGMQKYLEFKPRTLRFVVVNPLTSAACELRMMDGSMTAFLNDALCHTRKEAMFKATMDAKLETRKAKKAFKDRGGR